MHLSIYSLKQVLFDSDAIAVNCATDAGEITVLDNHEPLITTLKEHTLKITDATGKEHYIPIRRGFLEAANNTTLILADEPAQQG